MKTHCLICLIFWIGIGSWDLWAAEFDRRVDISLFLQKDGTCYQASLSSSNFRDDDLDVLKSYAHVNSMSICFGGLQSQLTSQRLKKCLIDSNVKEIGLLDCENNLHLITAALLSNALTRLKIRVAQIDDTIINKLAELGEGGAKIELSLFLTLKPNDPALEKIGLKLTNFKRIHINGHIFQKNIK